MHLLKRIIAALPEGRTVNKIVVSPLNTLVRCGEWGASSTFCDPGERGVAAGECLVGLEGKQAAGYALSDRLIEASWGMAAVNALLQPVSLKVSPLNASGLLARVGRGKLVAAVGAFPFLEELKPLFSGLEIIDRPPWLGARGVEAARKILPRAEVVAITGSSFVNHTAERLLELCPRAYVLVLGPTTPLTPVLFDYGVDAICGAVISDAGRVCAAIRQGISFRRSGSLDFVTAFRG